MLFLSRFRCPGIPRIIKKYWPRIFTFFFIAVIIVILLLKWKYGLELIQLSDMRKANLRKVQKIADLSTKSIKHDTWRTLDSADAAIFSAYLDARPEVVLEQVPNASNENLWALIRIVAILDVGAEKSQLTCHYKFPPNPVRAKSTKSVYAESPALAVKIIAKTENFGMRYSAAFVLCRLVTTSDGRLPLEIAFSTKSGQTSRDLGKQNFVGVRYTTRIDSRDQDRFMALCVPSLHHGYDKYANLIEFVEFYRMMGVEHFTFYNTSVTEEVGRVLARYEDEGLATVLHWQLPSQYVYERNLRYNGIFAAMNDCLYRNTMIGGYKYVLNVDLDEFVVPRKHENFREMMAFLDPPSEDVKYASFLLRNMFFYLMHDDSSIPQNQSDIPKLLLHTKTTRLAQINPAYDRSKYIARGQEIVEMGNHRVWQTKKYSLVFQTSYGEMIVDPEIAGSQHYRSCEVNELVCWLRNTVVDAAAHKFTAELGARVSAILKTTFPKSVH